MNSNENEFLTLRGEGLGLSITHLKGPHNLADWKETLELCCTLYDCQDVLLGLVKPEEDDKNASKEWRRGNTKARAFILMTIPVELRRLLIDKHTDSSSLYQAVIEEIEPATDVTLEILSTEMDTIHLSHFSNVTSYLERIQYLNNAMSSKDQAFPNWHLINRAIRGLTDAYTTWSDHYRNTTDLTSLRWSELVSVLLKQEQRLNARENGTYAMAVKAPKYAHNSPPAAKERTREKCSHCQKTGHNKEKCWQLHPEAAPQGFKTKPQGNNRQPNFRHAKPPPRKPRNEGFDIVASLSTHALDKDVWILDSGANCHVSSNRDWITGLQGSDGVAKTPGATASLPIKGKGSVVLKTSVGCNLTVTDVHYAPTAGCNLLSASQLSRHGVTCTLGEEALLYSGERLIARALLKNGLYELQVQAPLVVARTQIEAPLGLWHRRLGHTAYEQVRKTNSCVRGMDLRKKDLEWQPSNPCHACLGSKTLRQFPKIGRSTTRRPLELIHSDIWSMNGWEGLDPKTWGRSVKNIKHVLTFTDDYSRFSTVFFLSNKGNATSKIQAYVRWIEAQNPARMPVMAIRSDKGTEFLAAHNQSWLESRGITLQTTAGYAPHQNGVAERLNRILMDKARAMILDAGLDNSLWTYAFQQALYLKNLLQNKVTGKTPYEAFYGVKPDLYDLRVWGCTAYYRLVSSREVKPKLDSRAAVGYFVGHSHNHGYYIWQPSQGYVTVRTHTKFVETQFKGKSALQATQTPYDVPEDDSSDRESQSSSSSSDSGSSDSAGEGNTPGEPLVETGGQQQLEPPEIGKKAAGKKPAGPPRRSPRLQESSEPEQAARKTAPASKTIPKKYRVTGPNNRYTEKEKTYADGFKTGRPEVGFYTTPKRDWPPLGNSPRTITKKDTTKPLKDPTVGQFYPVKDRNREESQTAEESQSETEIRGGGTIHQRGQPKINTLIALAAARASQGEPETFNQALQGSDAKQWFLAMKDEVQSLITNQVWEECDPPAYGNVLKGRWVFRKKLNSDGTIAKYKARWVAKGFNQIYGVDYEETFASVVKPMSYRPLFAIAAQLDWQVHQMDVRTAFLNAPLSEAVLVMKPTGYDGLVADDFQATKDKTTTSPKSVCRLRRALYGLKQAPRAWYDTLKVFLESQGMEAMTSDRAIFRSMDPERILFLAVYVDDILLFSPEMAPIISMKGALATRFSMTDLKECGTFLGVQISRNRKTKTISLCQRAYVAEVINRANLEDLAPKATPMDAGSVLVPSEAVANPTITKAYQSLLGSLMYLVVETRPDIAHAVGVLSRFASNPDKSHFNALNRVVAYLKSSLTLGIQYHQSGELIGYADADYAADRELRRSTTGWIFLLGGGPISWASRRQKCTAQSTCEAELISASDAAKEAIWLRKLLLELRVPEVFKEGPVVLLGDNQSALHLARNDMFHQRTKHIEVRYHLIRELVEKDQIDYSWIPTKEMVADGLTKPLPKPAFNEFVTAMHLCPITEGSST